MPFPPGAPPPWMGQLFINAGECGFSEVYYLTALTSEAAVSALEALAGLRQAILPDKMSIKYGRVSDPFKRGDAYVITSFEDGGVGAITSQSMTPCVAALLRYESGDGHHAIHYLHGVPCSAVTGDWVIDSGSEWADSLEDYIIGVQAACEMVVTPFGGGAPESRVIDDIKYGPTHCRKIGRPFGVCKGRRANAEL